MNQEEWDILLFEYWQGENLSEEELQTVTNWLEEKDSHRQYYEDLQRAFLCQRWAMREKLINQKAERRFLQVARRKIVIWRLMAFAACVSAFVLFGIGYFQRDIETKDVQFVGKSEIFHGSSTARLFLSSGDVIELENKCKTLREQQSVTIDVKQEGIAAYRDSMIIGKVENMVYNKLVVNRGGEYHILLADGSEVWVNSDSELEFPIRFVGEKRIVSLKGEAYFKVKADANHPFIVKANGIVVEAVGTEFNVNSRKKSVVESVLVHGNVEVENSIRYVILNPNQLAVCNVETNGIEVKDVDVRKYIDWKNGNFVFSDDRLEDVMDKLALWYDCDVVYSDENLKEIRLSGDMKRYTEVDEFLHFLEISTGIRFSVKDKTIVVSIK